MSLFERVLLALVLLFWAALGAAVLTVITFATYLAIVVPREPHNDMAGLGVTLFALLTVPAGAALGALTGLFRGGDGARWRAGALACAGAVSLVATAYVCGAWLRSWLSPVSLWPVIAWSLYAVVAGLRGLGQAHRRPA